MKRSLPIITGALLTLACSSSQFGGSGAKASGSSPAPDPAASSATATATGTAPDNGVADDPLQVNGAMLTCAWQEIVTASDVAVTCGIVDAQTKPVTLAPTETVTWQVTDASGKALPAELTPVVASDQSRIACALPAKDYPGGSAVATVAGGDKSLTIKLAFTDAFPVLSSSATFVTCLGTAADVAACFQAAGIDVPDVAAGKRPGDQPTVTDTSTAAATTATATGSDTSTGSNGHAPNTTVRVTGCVMISGSSCNELCQALATGSTCSTIGTDSQAQNGAATDVACKLATDVSKLTCATVFPPVSDPNRALFTHCYCVVPAS